MGDKKYTVIILTLTALVAVVVTLIILRVNRQENFDESVPEELIDEESRRREEGERQAVRLYELHPLATELPYYSEEFEVHYGIKNIETYDIFYTVVLLPQSSPANTELYTAEVERLRDEALTWIKSKGVSPDNLEIEWTTR